MFIKEYIQLYLEAALPKYPIEGITAVTSHLTTTSLLAHVSSGLGTKDIILADVSTLLCLIPIMFLNILNKLYYFTKNREITTHLTYFRLFF